MVESIPFLGDWAVSVQKTSVFEASQANLVGKYSVFGALSLQRPPQSQTPESIPESMNASMHDSVTESMNESMNN